MISDIISSVEQVTDPVSNSEAKKAKRKKRKDKEEILLEPIITPKNILSSLRHVYFILRLVAQRKKVIYVSVFNQTLILNYTRLRLFLYFSFKFIIENHRIY